MRLAMRRPSGIDARTFGLGGELHHLHADQLQGSTFMPISAPSSTTDLPSGVQSETDESTHRRVNFFDAVPCAG